jgi:fructose-bisphosphate aldolase class I
MIIEFEEILVLESNTSFDARFAKWLAVIDINDRFPTRNCISVNAHVLACYAPLCQATRLVPVVEPEIRMDTEHTLERCSEVTKNVLQTVFNQLYTQQVMLERLILKPNVVLPGLTRPKQQSVDGVANATMKCLFRVIQQPVLEIWRGEQVNVPAAQKVLLHRVRCNRVVRRGECNAAIERKPT